MMFQGSMVALVTPMNAEQEIDYAAFEGLIDWHLQAGTHALIVAGTTGESATLEPNEIASLLRMAVKKVAGRVPVIAGTGHAATRHTILLSEQAKQCGVDACLVMAPPYIKPTQQGLYLHYAELAKSVTIPIILYNVPGRTVTDISPETVARLAEIPNIVGIKEATGDLQRLQAILELAGDQIDLYSGDDATAMEFMWNGGKGVISVTANVAPSAMVELCQSAIGAQDKTLSYAINQRLALLHKRLFVEANPIPVKWVLAQMGRLDNYLRLPLTPLSSNYYSSLVEAMQQAGIKSSVNTAMLS